VTGIRSGSELNAENSKLKIAVLAGGIGAEREISIQSGRCVAEALEHAGFDVVMSDIRPDYLDVLDDESIDVFFPALHGEFGEDGQVQRILEDRSLTFTGSGSARSPVKSSSPMPESPHLRRLSLVPKRI